MHRLSATFIAITILIYCDAMDLKEYFELREKMRLDELLRTVGGNVSLTDKEIEVNQCLMGHKAREVNRAFDNPREYDFYRHFFSYKNSVKNSKVYKIIKDMPKGGALHVHDMGILGPDYLLNLTYMDALYVCFGKKDMKLLFSADAPNKTCEASWILMSEARKASHNVTGFDSKIRKHFTLVVDRPEVAYPCIEDTWKAFMNYFKSVAPMLTYRPVWEKYFYDALQEFRLHNVKYVEVRSILPQLYELDGTIYDQIITTKSYKKVIDRFKKDYPDFIGAKLIYAPSRLVSTSTLGDYMKLCKLIKQEMPETFAGFDIVGQEDLGMPLLDFVPELIGAAKEFNYFFHAGETNWYGSYTDDNLVDAILLGAKRIGHGYALIKHPLLIEEIVKKDIAIEVNVISNTVLSLVRDVRNHPLSSFLAQGLPVVLSSDDPGAWEADVISEDYYVAFVGAASWLSDLRMLKTLSLNSLKYSAMGVQEKLLAIFKFHRMWDDFVLSFNCSKY